MSFPEHLRRFIEITPWTFAKTYAKTWPHEYIVREKVEAGLFDALAGHIDEHGYAARFYQANQVYFDHAGRTYWHMDNIVNRCLEADTYHRREKEGRLPGTDNILKRPEFPWPKKPWLLSGRFVDALEAAAAMFAGRKRKGSGIPYISHLLAACSIALDNGADEDQAIAALFHDAIEDIEETEKARTIVGLFGREVLRIVEACSDSDTHPKPDWQKRKEGYLARISEEDHAVLLVSISDKLHNARSISSDLRKPGPDVWDRFSAPREKQLWYYRELVKIYRRRMPEQQTLVDELEKAVNDMERLRDPKPPGPPSQG